MKCSAAVAEREQALQQVIKLGRELVQTKERATALEVSPCNPMCTRWLAGSARRENNA